LAEGNWRNDGIIDYTQKRRIRVRLELLGEPEPIEVKITKYNLKNKNSGARLTIEGATASVEWLAVGSREFVIGQKRQSSRKSRRIPEIIDVNY
jgi:hypothetical protein